MGLISGHGHRSGNRALKSSLAELIVGILRERYSDFGPTLAAEKLRSQHNIVAAKETVRPLQIASGLWIPRKLHPPKIHRPRVRRNYLGSLFISMAASIADLRIGGPACAGRLRTHLMTDGSAPASILAEHSDLSHLTPA